MYVHGLTGQMSTWIVFENAEGPSVNAVKLDHLDMIISGDDGDEAAHQNSRRKESNRRNSHLEDEELENEQ